MLFCHGDLENSREQERWVKPLWWWIWRFYCAVLCQSWFATPIHEPHHGGDAQWSTEHNNAQRCSCTLGF